MKYLATHTITFKNDDGSFSHAIYVQVIRSLTENGAWKKAQDGENRLSVGKTNKVAWETSLAKYHFNRPVFVSELYGGKYEQ